MSTYCQYDITIDVNLDHLCDLRDEPFILRNLLNQLLYLYS